MAKVSGPNLQTFQVKCVQCGGQRWPYLLERPTAYVCQMCRSMPKETRDERRAAGQRRAAITNRRRKAKPPEPK